jgi:hypothetical protein
VLPYESAIERSLNRAVDRLEWLQRGCKAGHNLPLVSVHLTAGRITRGRVRFTDKFTSPDSVDFNNEIGESGGVIAVMMSGKQTRARTSAAKPEEKRYGDKPTRQ